MLRYMRERKADAVKMNHLVKRHIPSIINMKIKIKNFKLFKLQKTLIFIYIVYRLFICKMGDVQDLFICRECFTSTEECEI